MFSIEIYCSEKNDKGINFKIDSEKYLNELAKKSDKSREKIQVYYEHMRLQIHDEIRDFQSGFFPRGISDLISYYATEVNDIYVKVKVMLIRKSISKDGLRLSRYATYSTYLLKLKINFDTNIKDLEDIIFDDCKKFEESGFVYNSVYDHNYLSFENVCFYPPGFDDNCCSCFFSKAIDKTDEIINFKKCLLYNKNENFDEFYLICKVTLNFDHFSSLDHSSNWA